MKEKFAQALSVIKLPHKPAVINKFDTLEEGESMVVVNEHNPILLYYQLLADRGNTFEWEYLDKGQDKWRVKITRVASSTPEPTVGELAARDARMAAVFQQLGIHYCCEGRKTVKESCQDAGIAPQKIDEQYEQVLHEDGEKMHDFVNWKPALLAKYMLKTFHDYSNDHTGKLYAQALSLAELDGPQQAIYKKLAGRLKHFFAYLNDHLQKEEQELYPLISTLEAAKKKKRRMVVPIVPTVGNRIKALEEEHTLLGEELKRFRAITRGYAQQSESCYQCKALYERLEEFGDELILHIHLENNILFPKVVAVEKELDSRNRFSR